MRIIKASEGMIREENLFDEHIITVVREIIQEVRLRGDEALKDYTEKFDGFRPERIILPRSEWKKAYNSIGLEEKKTMERIKDRLMRFALKQKENFQDFEMEIEEGVITGQKIYAIEKAGVYVPGGRYPLVSSVFMGVVPALAAGVEEIVLCVPPNKKGEVNSYVLAAAEICGISKIYTVGGAQAIAALAYGTDEVSCVDKIVGPGNSYVAAAKKEVFGRVGIDFVAGPSEILILASEDAAPELVAADLIAQGEHDPEAVPILVTLSAQLIDKVETEIEKQLIQLPTRETVRKSLNNKGLAVLAKSYKEAVEYINFRAPEHLELQGKEAEKQAPFLRNFGSLFIGPLSAEVLGDYSAGINHTLPTAFSPRYTGGLSVKDFLKIQTTLRLREDGSGTVKTLQDAVLIAEMEGLKGHSAAAQIRLNSMKGIENE